MAENKPKGKGKLLIVVALLLGLAGAGAFFLFSGRSSGNAKAEAAKVAEKPQTVNMETFLVNLADVNYRRYLKITLTVEFVGESTRQELEVKKYRIRDALLGVLRNKNAESLRDQEALRYELVDTVNNVLEASKIKNIYFQELVIQ